MNGGKKKTLHAQEELQKAGDGTTAIKEGFKKRGKVKREWREERTLWNLGGGKQGENRYKKRTRRVEGPVLADVGLGVKMGSEGTRERGGQGKGALSFHSKKRRGRKGSGDEEKVFVKTCCGGRSDYKK